MIQWLWWEVNVNIGIASAIYLLGGLQSERVYSRKSTLNHFPSSQASELTQFHHPQKHVYT